MIVILYHISIQFNIKTSSAKKISTAVTKVGGGKVCGTKPISINTAKASASKPAPAPANKGMDKPAKAGVVKPAPAPANKGVDNPAKAGEIKSASAATKAGVTRNTNIKKVVVENKAKVQTTQSSATAIKV